MRPRSGDTGKWQPGSLEFRNVVFGYGGKRTRQDRSGNNVDRPKEGVQAVSKAPDANTGFAKKGREGNFGERDHLLRDVSFKIEPGQNVLYGTFR